MFWRLAYATICVLLMAGFWRLIVFLTHDISHDFTMGLGVGVGLMAVLLFAYSKMVGPLTGD